MEALAATLPPGPRPRIPGALALEFWRDATGTLVRIAQEHGDVAGFRFGAQGEVLLNHPDLIRAVLVTEQRCFMKGQALQEAKRVLGDGLLTSEGDLHLRQRRLMQPLFHGRRLRDYEDTFAGCAEWAQSRWRDGDSIDVHAEMTRLTLDIVGRTLFAADVAGEAREIGEALTEALEGVNRLVYPWGHLLDRLPLESSRRFRRAGERLDATIYRLIAERRDSGATGSDLLSLLLAAQDEGGGMSDRQVRDEAMTLFLAGHETTANLLAWTLYLLSRHPEAERRTAFELAEGSDPTYTGMVLAEALRLYPPAWVIGRRALVDVDLGPVVIPSGMLAVLSPWVTHRDPRWYPEPQRFDPERWQPEARETRPQYAFFPFGAGTRMCIGEGFALAEARVVLRTLLPRWTFRLVPGQQVEVLPRVTLRPRHGLRMTVGRRRA
jgi:cytochrome P450